MWEKISEVAIFITAFAISSFAGLAALLRSGRSISTVAVVSAMLNSGMMGLVICLLWYNYFKDNAYFLVGMCILAGFGGMSVIEFLAAAIAKGGLNVRIDVSEEGKEKKNNEAGRGQGEGS